MDQKKNLNNKLKVFAQRKPNINPFNINENTNNQKVERIMTAPNNPVEDFLNPILGNKSKNNPFIRNIGIKCEETEHNTGDTEFFCQKCMKALCGTCSMTKHKDHSSSMIEPLDKCFASFNKNLETIASTFDNLRKIAEKVNENDLAVILNDGFEKRKQNYKNLMQQIEEISALDTEITKLTTEKFSLEFIQDSQTKKKFENFQNSFQKSNNN
jgi:hypothetical protein